MIADSLIELAVRAKVLENGCRCRHPVRFEKNGFAKLSLGPKQTPNPLQDFLIRPREVSLSWEMGLCLIEGLFVHDWRESPRPDDPSFVIDSNPLVSPKTL
jgi:hypothetical protein